MNKRRNLTKRNHKKYQTEIVERKNSLNEMKNAVENINDSLDQAEEKNSELKDRNF